MPRRFPSSADPQPSGTQHGRMFSTSGMWRRQASVTCPCSRSGPSASPWNTIMPEWSARCAEQSCCIRSLSMTATIFRSQSDGFGVTNRMAQSDGNCPVPICVSTAGRGGGAGRKGRIEAIDEDQGLTGSGDLPRAGFAQLTGQVARGQVGAMAFGYIAVGDVSSAESDKALITLMLRTRCNFVCENT